TRGREGVSPLPASELKQEVRTMFSKLSNLVRLMAVLGLRFLAPQYPGLDGNEEGIGAQLPLQGGLVGLCFFPVVLGRALPLAALEALFYVGGMLFAPANRRTVIRCVLWVCLVGGVNTLVFVCCGVTRWYAWTTACAVVTWANIKTISLS